MSFLFGSMLETSDLILILGILCILGSGFSIYTMRVIREPKSIIDFIKLNYREVVFFLIGLTCGWFSIYG